MLFSPLIIYCELLIFENKHVATLKKQNVLCKRYLHGIGGAAFWTPQLKITLEEAYH